MQDRVFALGLLHFPTSAFTVCNVALLRCFLPSLVSRWKALLCWAVCRTWFGLVVMSTQQLPSATGGAHFPYTHRWCKDMKVTWMTSWEEQTYQEDLEEIKDDNIKAIIWLQYIGCKERTFKSFFSKVQKSFFIALYFYQLSLLNYCIIQQMKISNLTIPVLPLLQISDLTIPASHLYHRSSEKQNLKFDRQIDNYLQFCTFLNHDPIYRLSHCWIMRAWHQMNWFKNKSVIH